ncbi:hypothetical protein [Cellulomonas sp. Leaf334]|uniref:hypothetical protein n=1 Tax=Cellulomonas sp. Leaf334 TaxID=1736339 RepID=UPI0006FA9969|nr:hypothetical protein [Cellulomonas sp. Leaf334]KQR17132.1 hypothetical protein ASF78_07425 [Cellulomonas sp. Leaf334]
MSTSDPHRPGGATDGPDETTDTGTDATPESSTSVEETTPAADDAGSHEVAPTVETLDPPTPDEPDPTPATTPEPAKAPEPVTPAEPVAGTIDADLPSDTSTTSTTPVTAATAAGAAATTARTPTTTTTEPGTDTGRHAIVRPAPTPPDEPGADTAAPVEPPPDPVTSSTPTPTPTPDHDTPEPVATPAAAPVAALPPASAPTPATTAAPVAGEDDRLFPDPSAPRSTSVGSHVLGVIVGLVLAPIGVAVLLLGESRILQAQVSGWDASTEVMGIVLVSLGLLLLGCVLLLALWTPAVPITGGAVLTLAGIVYLYLPSVAREQTLNLLTSSGWRLTVTQVTVAGTSGMVLAVGFLLLLAGIVAGSARRRGVRLGEFRERHRV